MPTYAPTKAALHIEPVNAYGNNGLRVTVETGSVILDTPTIDALIEELARLRSDMHPPVNREVDRKKPFLVEVDPDWHAQSNPLIDGSVLLLRHAGLGWTCFALPRESLKRLVNVLNELRPELPQAVRDRVGRGSGELNRQGYVLRRRGYNPTHRTIQYFVHSRASR